MRSAFALSLSLILGACASAPPTIFTPSAAAPSPTTAAPSTPPPQRPATPQPAPSNSSFVAPQIMSLPGLERIIGQSAEALESNLGKPRLNVQEGDARKLQFTSRSCVMDIYLYPLRPGGTPSATHVEARRASDGQAVDRVACLRSLEVN